MHTWYIAMTILHVFGCIFVMLSVASLLVPQRYHSNPTCPIFVSFTITNDDKKMSSMNTHTRIELVQPNLGLC